MPPKQQPQAQNDETQGRAWPIGRTAIADYTDKLTKQPVTLGQVVEVPHQTRLDQLVAAGVVVAGDEENATFEVRMPKRPTSGERIAAEADAAKKLDAARQAAIEAREKLAAAQRDLEAARSAAQEKPSDAATAKVTEAEQAVATAQTAVETTSDAVAQLERQGAPV